MGPGSGIEVNVKDIKSGSEQLNRRPHSAALSVTWVYYLRSSQFHGTFVQMKLIGRRRKIAIT